MNKKDAGLSKAIALGVWFGIHCGGGFATGAQGLIYFAIWAVPCHQSFLIFNGELCPCL